jgi:hypothetical protein
MIFRAKFGSLEEIDHQQFIEKVDNAPPSTFTVIHLYKDVCVIVE